MTEARTVFAQRAADVVAAFEAEVGRSIIEGPVPYCVELVAPEGSSTGGGARAVSHVRLVPLAVGRTATSDAATQLDLRGMPGQNIVIGSWDQVQRLATLRTWERLSEQYAQRFKGVRLPVDAVAYGRLMQRLETFFLERSARVEKESVVPAPAPVPAAAPAARSWKWLAAVTGLVGLGAGVLLGGAAMYFVLR